MNITVTHLRKCPSHVRNEFFIVIRTGKSLSKKRKTKLFPLIILLLLLEKWNGHRQKNFIKWITYTYSLSTIRIFYFPIYHIQYATNTINSHRLKSNF